MPQLKKAPDINSISNLQDLLDVSSKATEIVTDPEIDRRTDTTFKEIVLDCLLSLLETEGYCEQGPTGPRAIVDINFSSEEISKISEFLYKDIGAKYDDQDIAVAMEKIWLLIQGKFGEKEKIIVETRAKANLSEINEMAKIKMH